MRKANEWSRHVFIASLDIANAFDQLEAYSLERVVQEHQAPAWAIAAVLREMVDQKAWPTVPGVGCDQPVVLGTGTMQGAPGTPAM